MSGKNILIVTASMGAGHNKAANAISECIKMKYPENRVTIIDFMSQETAYLNSLVKDIYLKLLDHTPNIYEFFYKFTAKTFQGTTVQSIFAHAMKNDMLTLIKEHQADVLIFTHPFPCAAATYLKETKQIDLPIVTVVTDFCLHQFWIYRHVDLYFVATKQMKNDLVQAGIEEKRIFATGIPISPDFQEMANKEELYQKFELAADVPTVLIMGGGLGLGKVKDALCQLENLKMELQILVVTGTNISLWSEINELAGRSKHKIIVWGYSHNIREIMAVSTLLITKPGALTICEALASDLPMILHHPIPGPESDNAKYVANNGAAIWIKHEDTLDSVVRELLTDKTILPRLQKNIVNLKHPDAAFQIIQILQDKLLSN